MIDRIIGEIDAATSQLQNVYSAQSSNFPGGQAGKDAAIARLRANIQTGQAKLAANLPCRPECHHWVARQTS